MRKQTTKNNKLEISAHLLTNELIQMQSMKFYNAFQSKFINTLFTAICMNTVRESMKK